ncbi:MAG TPA: penicillin-binding protein 2 [Patescibacteria group bacterium]|nr:penicillin-binding protein 2 [Patescibacteria group bacterium]
MNPFEDKNYLNKKFDSGKNLSFEEIYADSKDEAPSIESERETINFRVLAVVAAIPILLLAGRLFFLQSVRGADFRAQAEGNKLRVVPTYAPRGLILDANGKTIAQNMPNFELDVIPSDLPSDQQAWETEVGKISQILNVDPQTIDREISPLDRGSTQTTSIVSSITQEQALALIPQISNYQGFSVEDNPIRDYKDAQVFAPVVGYTGKITQQELADHSGQGYLFNDYIGKTGLELQYENYLRGVSGQKQTEIDAQGNVVKSLADIVPKPGDNITLNIDYDLQKVIYDDLTKTLNQYHLTRGAAVATNPKTGQVLALVSIPSYDNSLFAKGISQEDYNTLLNNPDHPLLNRAISGLYPPGSTVKPMMAIAGLTEGVITPQTKILDDGVIRVGNFTFYGYEHSGLGIMDVYSAIAKSSDIYFYTVGGGRAGTGISGLGPDKIAEWFRKFHLGSKLNIDLPNEQAGLVPDPAWKQQTRNEQWYLGDTYHYSIGQGDLLVTPLQVNSWTATVANGGTVMQPYILNKITDQDGNVVKQMQPQVLAANQFDPNYIQVVQQGMRDTTLPGGSAYSLHTVGMSISGKTGSAQFDASRPDLTHAWFTSYAPSEDPQIALTVLVESAGEGAIYSVPISHEIYDWWAANRLNKNNQ